MIRGFLQWIRRFILCHDKAHPATMGKREITAFLTHLATAKNVAASTRNQPLSALPFLYKGMLKMGLETT